MEPAKSVFQTMVEHLSSTYDSSEIESLMKRKYTGEVTQHLNFGVRENKKGNQKPKVKGPRAGSNLSKARDLYLAAEDKSRKSIMALLQKELGLNPGTASTYHHMLRKEQE